MGFSWPWPGWHQNQDSHWSWVELNHTGSSGSLPEIIWHKADLIGAAKACQAIHWPGWKVEGLDVGTLQCRDNFVTVTLCALGGGGLRSCPLFQHSLSSLLLCSGMKPLQGTPNAETQWVKCHQSIFLDKRARLNHLESLPSLGSMVLPWHTSIKATCSYSAQESEAQSIILGDLRPIKTPKCRRRSWFILQGFQCWSHQLTPHANTIWDLMASTPLTLPHHLPSTSWGLCLSSSLSPGTRKDPGSSLCTFCSPQLQELRERCSGRGNQWGSPICCPAAVSQEWAFHLMCVTEKSLWWGWGMENGDSPLCYLQANPSSSAWSFLWGFIPSPSTTGAVTFPITLVSSSLTSRDWGSPKTGFVCI